MFISLFFSFLTEVFATLCLDSIFLYTFSSCGFALEQPYSYLSCDPRENRSLFLRALVMRMVFLPPFHLSCRSWRFECLSINFCVGYSMFHKSQEYQCLQFPAQIKANLEANFDSHFSLLLNAEPKSPLPFAAPPMYPKQGRCSGILPLLLCSPSSFPLLFLLLMQISLSHIPPYPSCLFDGLPRT